MKSKDNPFLKSIQLWHSKNSSTRSSSRMKPSKKNPKTIKSKSSGRKNKKVMSTVLMKTMILNLQLNVPSGKRAQWICLRVQGNSQKLKVNLKEKIHKLNPSKNPFTKKLKKTMTKNFNSLPLLTSMNPTKSKRTRRHKRRWKRKWNRRWKKKLKVPLLS